MNMLSAGYPISGYSFRAHSQIWQLSRIVFLLSNQLNIHSAFFHILTANKHNQQLLLWQESFLHSYLPTVSATHQYMNHPCDTIFIPNLATFSILLYTWCFLLRQFFWDSSFLFVHPYKLLRKMVYLLHALLEWPSGTSTTCAHCYQASLPEYLLWGFFPQESGLSLTEYSQTGVSTRLH